MDNSNTYANFVAPVAVVVCQLVAAYAIIFDDVLAEFEQ
jgi:hypothetical protein